MGVRHFFFLNPKAISRFQEENYYMASWINRKIAIQRKSHDIFNIESHVVGYVYTLRVKKGCQNYSQNVMIYLKWQ